MKLHSGQHNLRLARARRSLDGLMIGDAFGERFFGDPHAVRMRIRRRDLPKPEWGITDDSVMACGLVEVLARKGSVEQDLLADVFSNNYLRDPMRGYGSGAQSILQLLSHGGNWRNLVSRPFGGAGSMGNGAAMRVAPLGAFFADDLEVLVEQAALQAQVTHDHAEAHAGAVAVAVAAAMAWSFRDRAPDRRPRPGLLRAPLEHIANSEVADGLERAIELGFDVAVPAAVAALGNGSGVLAQDTVPFALWCAARHFGSFEETMWTTVEGLGDRDTTCAIAGGIAALADPPPDPWLRCVEHSSFVETITDVFSEA